jgi:hypothetical protein
MRQDGGYLSVTWSRMVVICQLHEADRMAVICQLHEAGWWLSAGCVYFVNYLRKVAGCL